MTYLHATAKGVTSPVLPARKTLSAAIMALALGGCAVNTKPVTQDDAIHRAQNDLASMFTEQEPVTQSIDLYEAMARALKYNYDYRLSMMEQAVSQQQMDVEKYNLLPKLAVEAGYRKRSNDLASYSESLDNPGNVEVNNSISQERERATGETRMVWNVLDFGVSYMRAKQAADNAYIAEERRRKVVQNIVQEVREAYWRAVAAERDISQLQQVSDRVRLSLGIADTMRDQRLRDPLLTLEYSRDLLETLSNIERRKSELAAARSDLARLMNLKPGTAFELVMNDESLPAMSGASLPAMQLAALSLRPELKEQDYTSRIVAQQSRIDKLQLLPNLSLDLSMNYDSNKYLYHQGWSEAGANLSLDLVKLASYGDVNQLGKLREQVADTQRKATTMAVLTQVEIAERTYRMARENYCIADKLSGVQQQRVKYYQSQSKTSAGDDLAMAQAEADAMLAKINQHFQYAELQAAQGLVLNSVGIDPLPAAVASHDVASLRQELKQYFEKELDTSVGKMLAHTSELVATPQPVAEEGAAFCQ